MDDKPTKPPLINPFLAARKSSDIIACICQQNVRAFRPQWTQQQAEDFLKRNAEAIAVCMIEAGIHALRQILEDNHAN
jgi:hypothetical protein